MGGSQDQVKKLRLSGALCVFSILIFMALKNSKTGSLPVSEIYNFMTEHFPYFKVSPRSICTHHPKSWTSQACLELQGSVQR